MDRVFKYALIFSIFFHAAVITEWPFYRYFFPHKNQYKDIEITYLKIKESAPPPALPKETFTKISQPQLEFPQPTKMTSAEFSKMADPKKSKTIKSKSEEKKLTSEQKPFKENKEPFIQKSEGITSIIDLKGLRSVPPSYAQAVRNKIRRNLDSAKPMIEGDVFVRFVIVSDGRLQQLSIIDEKSTRNGFLREMVFEAIKNSSPFPRFPKGVAIPEAIFTCQISFELK